MSERIPFWSTEAPAEIPLALPTVANVRETTAGLYIGRPMPGRPELGESDWQNTAKLTKDTDDDRRSAIRTFAIGLLETQQRARLPELAGQTLLCWCHPKRCHGHALAELVAATRYAGSRCPHCAAPVVSYLNWHDHLGLSEAWICTGRTCGRRGHASRATPDCLQSPALLL